MFVAWVAGYRFSTIIFLIAMYFHGLIRSSSWFRRSGVSDLSSPTQTAPILCLSPVERRIATAGLGRGAAAQAVGEALSVTGVRQRREGRFVLTLCL